MRRLAALGAIVASLAFTGTAAAVPPESDVITIDQTSVDTETCGFALTEHFQGDLRQTTFLDNDGNPVRFLETTTHGAFSDTITANGKTLVAIQPLAIKMNFLVGTTTFMGLLFKATVPGAGTILLDAGRLVFDANGGIVFEVGKHQLIDGDVDAFCAFFADP